MFYFRFILLFILYILLCSSATNQATSSIKRIWGPGLRPDIYRLPVRYFFIETINNGTESLQESPLRVTVEAKSENGRQCRIWTNILDRKDGSFIVRYKLYETCSDPSIIIKYQDIASEPITLKGTVRHEECNCPEMNLEDVLSSWDCGAIPKQLELDLSAFPTVNWDGLREEIIKHFNNPGAVSLCHYVIKDNELYNKCYGQHVGFQTFMNSMLLSMSRKFFLPDMEFFVNLGDYPLVPKANGNMYPIFSWCGSSDSFDIVMPTYDLTQSTLENMGKVMLDMLSVQGNADLEWNNRFPKAFWRGRDSNLNRLKLIKIARDNPDLFNASLTNFFFYRDVQDVYGPKTEHVSFFKFFDYKYQINIDGTVAAYRFPYLLAGESAVFKQDSKYYEHFYDLIVPNQHFIPVREDLSDLVKKIKWAIDHDEEAKQIAKQGRLFANTHLLPLNIYCYHAFLLQEFKKKISSSIKILDGMEKIPQPKSQCTCTSIVKDEL